jgi:ABC-2 type transport system permease protein
MAGAGFAVVWPEFLAAALIGGLFFALALWRLRRVRRHEGRP